MAELTTLARPYAKAAFGFALAKQDLEAWSKMLGSLSAICADEKVQQVLNSPALTSEQQVATIIEICGDELNEGVKNFVSLLAENKRLLLLPVIAEQFEVLKAQQDKIGDVAITSAYSLDNEVEENLAKVLTTKLNCEVKITSTVDESLIGGAIIRAGDLVIDSSLRNRLTKLHEAMNS